MFILEANLQKLFIIQMFDMERLNLPLLISLI